MKAMGEGSEFNAQVQALLTRMGEHRIMCLATTDGRTVSARAMSFVIEGGVLYFQTDSRMRKFAQIQQNAQVAISWENVQIEGTCVACGHPLAAGNEGFARRFAAHYAGAFALYSAMPEEVLCKVVPTRIVQWVYEEKKPYQLYLDMEKKTFCRKAYVTEEKEAGQSRK